MALAAESKGFFIQGAVCAAGMMIGALSLSLLFREWNIGTLPSIIFGCAMGGAVALIAANFAFHAKRRRNDRRIVQSAERAGFPAGVTVHAGYGRVTLEGEVDRDTLRREAGRIAGSLPGARETVNRIRVHPGSTPVTPENVRRQIEDALQQSEDLSQRAIRIHMENLRVILEGAVHSVLEADLAEEVAWGTPGVKDVENRLSIVKYP